MTHKPKKSEHENVQETANAEAQTPEPQERDSELGELEVIRKELEAKEKQITELSDRLLRNQAENENFQKRVKKEQVEFMRFATEKLVHDLLPVMDDLERAIVSAEQGKDFDALVSGVKLIFDHLKGA